MHVQSIKTSVFTKGEDLNSFLLKHLDALVGEGDIVLVTSKIVSIAEDRFAAADSDKLELCKQEADHYLGEIGYGCHLTIKDNLMLPSAGIDESNSATGEFILLPSDSFQSAKKIYKFLKSSFNLKSLGVIITDSHTQPLRHGTLGISLAYWGFKGLLDKVNQPDLFGRTLLMTQQNRVDALAAAGVLLMGEGAECCPLAVIKQAPVLFTEKDPVNELSMDLEEDLYNPLYSSLL